MVEHINNGHAWITKHKRLTILFSILIVIVVISLIAYGEYYPAQPQTTIGIPGNTGNTQNYSPTFQQNQTGIGNSQKSASNNAGASSDLSVSSSRLTTASSTVSMAVKDVDKTVTTIQDYASGKGGYMVSVNYENASNNATAEVTIAIPNASFRSAIAYIKTLGVEVTNESLTGQDVTGQYTDTQAQVAEEKTALAQLEGIQAKATDTAVILSIEQQIIQVQQQIDNLVGQQNNLEAQAAFPQITADLSTAVSSLPYTTQDDSSPANTLKQATQSLLHFLLAILGMLIYIGVYGVIWIPLLIIIVILYRMKRSKTTSAAKQEKV